MPIYEYRCDHCGHECEILHKINDTSHTTCSQCNHPSLVKLISASRFQLKGTGWYETDFKTKKQTAPTNNATSSSTPTPAATSASTQATTNTE